MYAFPHPYPLQRQHQHLGLVPDEWADSLDLDDRAVPGWDTVVFEVDEVPADDAWRQAALCAETDPEAFFPEKGGSTREAKRVCAGCPVLTQCLEYALGNDERFGIWGGLSERERRRIRLQRRVPLSA